MFFIGDTSTLVLLALTKEQGDEEKRPRLMVVQASSRDYTEISTGKTLAENFKI